MDIAIVGEAWGEQEERQRKPFVGPTGWHLSKMLEEADIRRGDCFLTNVFNLRPPGNDIEHLCGPKEIAIKGYPSLGAGVGYVQAKYTKELIRLAAEMHDVNPNLIIAMGRTAMWAFLGKSSITKSRGVVQYSTHTVAEFKTLPTYHPAACFRNHAIRPVIIADLIKASRERQYPDIRRPSRKIWIEPTLEDLYVFEETYIKPAQRLAVDIETSGVYITLIGIAPSREIALVIPFPYPGRSKRVYWPDAHTEAKVGAYIARILRGPILKTFQNGLYDINFLWRSARMKVYNAEHDTMLLHHALQPESLKGLGFLGSVYTDEGSWKDMRVKSTIKRED
jgi:DNA polymerase